MTRIVEVSPEALGAVRDDVAATRDAIRDDLAPLRWRMSNLNVPTGAMHDVLAVADQLDADVLPTLDWHVARARDLATLRYGGAMGAALPVVDDDEPFAPAPDPFTHTPWNDGSTALSWPAAPLEDQDTDRRDTESSDPISAWFEDRIDDLAASVHDGADWLADTWDRAVETGADIGDWWEETSAELGGWIDENLDDVRELIGRHVAVFRFLADVCRVLGWVVVASGVVLTVALAVIGAMGGSAFGALFGLGVGAVPGGAAGAIAGASVGLKILGAGFTLLAVGDFLDIAADWGEGTIDGQDLVQQGGLEIAIAVGSLVGFGAVGKILQKTYPHLPDSWVTSIDDLLRPPAQSHTGVDARDGGRVLEHHVHASPAPAAEPRAERQQLLAPDDVTPTPTLERAASEWPITPEPDTPEYALGYDPAIAKFRLSEYQTATRIIDVHGLDLTRASPGDAYDWVDRKTGKTYDAVGNFPARFFDDEWPTLQERILDHLEKADVVPVDVAQFTAEQRAMVRQFVEQFGDRVLIVGE